MIGMIISGVETSLWHDSN